MNIENNGVILITGATKGIGLATTAYLAEQGYKIYATYPKGAYTEELEQAVVKSKGLIEKIRLDVADEESVCSDLGQLLLRTRRIDVVIDNERHSHTEATEPFTWEPSHIRYFDDKFYGVVNVVKAILPYFRLENRGQIINIGDAAHGAYSKYALTKLTESMAAQLAPVNIKVSLVEPRTEYPSLIGASDLGAVNSYTNYHNVAPETWAENMPPETDFAFAKLIHSVILERKPKLYYPFGEHATQLVESKFKNLNSSKSIDKQITAIVKSCLSPHAPQHPSFDRIKQAIYKEIDMHISEKEMEEQGLIGKCSKIDPLTSVSSFINPHITLKTFKKLIEATPYYKFETAGKDGWNALNKAALVGNLDIMKYIIKHLSISDLNATSDRQTPLYSAIQLTNTLADRAFLTTKLLINSGANINLSKIYSPNLLTTPLWFAGMKSSYDSEVINLLILNGGVVYVGTLDIKVRTSIDASLMLLYARFRTILAGLYDNSSNFYTFNRDLIREITLKPYVN